MPLDPITHNYGSKMCPSDGLGMEKVGFGRVQVYPIFQMSGSGIGKVGFVGGLKFRASGIFE